MFLLSFIPYGKLRRILTPHILPVRASMTIGMGCPLMIKLPVRAYMTIGMRCPIMIKLPVRALMTIEG
jgi:hypothetical protein